MTERSFSVRRARTADVAGIQALLRPLSEQGIMLGKESVELFESIQQFRVAVAADGTVIGCGALHIFWQDLGEIRTMVVGDDWRGSGVGKAIFAELEGEARELGLTRLFCLTFEVDFFSRMGFTEVSDEIIAPEVYDEMLRSHDEGVAEFLDIARVKPNTLGNTRMLRLL
jgi:amino-acid N-acetyltransferase